MREKHTVVTIKYRIDSSAPQESGITGDMPQ